MSTFLGALLLHTPPATTARVGKVPVAAAKVAAEIRTIYGAILGARAHAEAENRIAYGTLAAVPAALTAVDPKVYGALVALPAAPSFTTAEPDTTAEPEDVAAAPAPDAAAPETAEAIPLPPRRPFEGGLLADRAPPQASGRLMAHAEATATVPATAASDQRNFFEKMFDIGQSSGQVLAYAAPEDGLANPARNAPSAAALSYGPGTAVYDIAAHTVYMPDGTKLEAHSGFGAELDDPQHVNEKMRGATPPNVYELKPRETLFHGVQALRLIPVGSGKVFGREGLLAHTYMLGPNGQSNGCVSFKDYNAFLDAYKKGEVKRLVVVAGLN